MKKYFLLIITILVSITNNFAQSLEVEISNLHYQNGNSISNCGEIDFQSNSSITLVFDVELEKPSSQATGDGSIYIYTKNNPAYSEIERGNSYVPSGFWLNDTYTKYDMEVVLYASDYDISGGVFFASYTTNSNARYDSCHYSIIKDEVPTFELNPSSTTVSCGSTSSKSFSVSNVYNSPGTLEYHWSVGNGWKDTNGNIVHNFTTTSSNITLVPYQFPPSNVHVTPYLDGEPYDELISTITLSEISTEYNINGNSSICTVGVYSIVNIPSNWNVTWNTSSSNATLNTINNHQVEVTVSGNSGNFNLNATIINPCGQTKESNPKAIHFGRPARPAVIYGPTSIHSESHIRYRINPVTNATSYEWRLPYPFTVVNHINDFSRNWQLQSSGSSSTNINAFTGTEGNSGYVQVWGKNQCGNGAARYIRVSQGGSNNGNGPNAAQVKIIDTDKGSFNKYFSIFPNPANKYVLINKLKQYNNPNIRLELYNIQGFLIQKFNSSFNRFKLDTEKYKNGIYIFNAIIDDKVYKQKLIIKHN
jgi:hypothetical protein